MEYCPVCRYRLAGLPAEYRCPECGFPFDDSMEVFEARRGDGVVVHITRTALTIWVVSDLLPRWFIAGGATPLILLDLAAVLLLGQWWVMWWQNRRRRFITLTDTSVSYWDGRAETLRFPLSAIYAAEYNSLSSDIDLIAPDGSRIGSLPDLRQRDYRDIVRLCRAITERAAQRNDQQTS